MVNAPSRKRGGRQNRGGKAGRAVGETGKTNGSNGTRVGRVGSRRRQTNRGNGSSVQIRNGYFGDRMSA